MPVDEPLAVEGDGTSERRGQRVRALCIVLLFTGGVRRRVALWGLPASRDRVLIG